MQKDADIKALESEGVSSKPTGYVQIIYLILFLPNITVLKVLEDEGISVAPQRHPTLSTPSAMYSLLLKLLSTFLKENFPFDIGAAAFFGIL
jgi:hypothetical protein